MVLSPSGIAKYADKSRLASSLGRQAAGSFAGLAFSVETGGKTGSAGAGTVLTPPDLRTPPDGLGPDATFTDRTCGRHGGIGKRSRQVRHRRYTQSPSSRSTTARRGCRMQSGLPHGFDVSKSGGLLGSLCSRFVASSAAISRDRSAAAGLRACVPQHMPRGRTQPNLPASCRLAIVHVGAIADKAPLERVTKRAVQVPSSCSSPIRRQRRIATNDARLCRRWFDRREIGANQP